MWEVRFLHESTVDVGGPKF